MNNRFKLNEDMDSTCHSMNTFHFSSKTIIIVMGGGLDWRVHVEHASIGNVHRRNKKRMYGATVRMFIS